MDLHSDEKRQKIKKGGWDNLKTRYMSTIKNTA